MFAVSIVRLTRSLCPPPAGRAGPEKTGVSAVRGGGRCSAAAQRHCGGALQETSPQKCAQEEAGRGETPAQRGWIWPAKVGLSASGTTSEQTWRQQVSGLIV